MTTLRTSRADKNYLSITDSEVWWHLGTDNPVPCPSVNDIPAHLIPAVPQDWDAVLKVSSNDAPVYMGPNSVRHGEVIGSFVRIAQGRENAIDCNRMASYVDIDGDIGWGGGVGDQVITIKGGSHHITIRGTIHSRGTNACVVIGQWSDQSTDKTSHVDLVDLKRADGKPVTVILVRADHGTIHLPKGAKVLWLKSLCFKAYWWGKLAAVKLGLFR